MMRHAAVWLGRANRNVVSLAALLVTFAVTGVGCGSPQFESPRAPTFSASLSQSAFPPAAVALELPPPSLEVVVDGAEASVRVLPEDPRIAIMFVGTSDVASARARDLAETGAGSPANNEFVRAVQQALLMAGYSRLVGPGELSDVVAEKIATRDGTVSWKATLGQLMLVEPLGSVDLLVCVDQVEIARGTTKVTQHYSIDGKALAVYQQQHDALVAEVDERLTTILKAREAYDSAFRKASATYEADGGSYNATGPVAQLTSGDKAVALPSALVSVQIRLVDASNLRLLWIATLETVDENVGDAIQRVAERVVAEVEAVPKTSSAGVVVAP